MRAVGAIAEDNTVLGYCNACFTGSYPIPLVEQGSVQKFWTDGGCGGIPLESPPGLSRIPKILDKPVEQTDKHSLEKVFGS